MKKKINSSLWIITQTAIAASVVFSLGCQQQSLTRRKENIQCPEMTLQQIKTAVLKQRVSMLPVKGRGDANFKQYDEAGKVKRNENLSAHIRLYPEHNLFFRADNLLGEVILAGTNPDWFWMRIKPENIYYYGAYDVARRCRTGLLLGPDTILEAFGVIDMAGQWLVHDKPGITVLTSMKSGKVGRKVYFDRCDQRIFAIEYSTSTSQTVRLDIRNYKQVKGSLYLPGKITISSYQNNALKTVFDVEFKTLDYFEPTDTQIAKLFTMPSAKGQQNVYYFDDSCRFILRK